MHYCTHNIWLQYIKSILDSQGVWLVKKRKETPGWSFHFPHWSAWQNTALCPPLTALCSSWIRYLQFTKTHTLLAVYTHTVCSGVSMEHDSQQATEDSQNWINTHLIHPLLAMTSAWLSLSTSPEWMRGSRKTMVGFQIWSQALF